MSAITVAVFPLGYSIIEFLFDPNMFVYIASRLRPFFSIELISKFIELNRLYHTCFAKRFKDPKPFLAGELISKSYLSTNDCAYRIETMVAVIKKSSLSGEMFR